MKRLVIAGIVVGLLVAAVAFSGGPKAPGDLQVTTESQNPWTNLRLNNDPDDFQFAIVSDRTGGHRPRVFSLAVEQLNLLQPQFVITVGDLIEGYKETPAKLAEEWKEFQSYVARLQMPFFYVPGNHDLSNLVEEKLWKEKFGRRYYHFTYRNVLFLLLSSEDDPEAKGGRIGLEQLAYVKEVLENNKSARWTIVILHRPLWASPDVEKTGWLEVEKALGDRPCTVFAGHVHRYRKFLRNGHSYYQLATTGGGSKMRGVRYGEFDHLVWVTMKKSGPVLANLLLNGILPEDLRPLESSEPGVNIAKRKPVYPVRGKVVLDGKPIPDALVEFYPADKKAGLPRADALADEDGSFVLSTYQAQDGAAAGEFAVTVVLRKVGTGPEEPGPNLLPARYGKPETTPLKVRVQQGPNEVILELQKDR